ncbi:MAG: hypothetical protein ACLPR9_00715 [Acidimicrobiales bacterium]
MHRSLIFPMALAATAALLTGTAEPAHAGASGSDGPGGTVNVGAGSGGTQGGVPGSPGGGGEGAGQGINPWTCSYTDLVLNNEGGIAPGGPTPGAWYSVTCNDRLTGTQTTQTEWIPDQSTPSSPAVDPRSVALQAERSLALPAPGSHFNPTAASVVNLPTWLWIDAGIWHSYSITASVGSVSATAVANPTLVTWSMGDGGQVTCPGPGTSYNLGQPSSGQSTQCEYSYLQSSAGQPSPNGNPDDGAFAVSATVSWAVSWSAQGTAGGGELPMLSTSSRSTVRVEQVQSINSNFSAAPAAAPLGEGPTS